MKHLSKELEFLNDLFSHVQSRGLMLLEASKDESSNGIIHYKGKPLTNFLTNSSY